MARDLYPENHKLIFVDELNLIDGKPTRITLWYRLPTTVERIAYRRDCLKQDKSGTWHVDVHEARQDHGLPLITGFATGDFSLNGVPISSNPESEYFLPDWRQHIEQYAGDIIAHFSRKIFESGTMLTEEQDMWLETLNQPPTIIGSGSEPAYKEDGDGDPGKKEGDSRHPLP